LDANDDVIKGKIGAYNTNKKDKEGVLAIARALHENINPGDGNTQKKPATSQ